MSKKPTGKPSAAAAAKAAQQAEAQSTDAAKQSNQTAINAVENQQVKTPPEAVKVADDGAKDAVDQEVLDSISEQTTDPEPEMPPVPPVTAAAKAKSKSQPDPEPDNFEPVTVENCTHFESKNGRVFPATEVLRRLARRQDLKPVNLAE